jgi:hypothetical protein
MICKRCKEKPTVHPRSELCVECRPIVKKDIRDRANRKSNKRIKAERAAAKESKKKPCRCGCGVLVQHPNKWAAECREASKKALSEAYLQKGRDRRKEAAAKKKAANPGKKPSAPRRAEVPALTLQETIAEANQMRDRLSRLNPVLFAQRMGYGAIT